MGREGLGELAGQRLLRPSCGRIADLSDERRGVDLDGSDADPRRRRLRLQCDGLRRVAGAQGGRGDCSETKGRLAATKTINLHLTPRFSFQKAGDWRDFHPPDTRMTPIRFGMMAM